MQIGFLISDHGIPLIESLANLAELRTSRMYVFAQPLPAYGADAIPLRVLAFELEEGDWNAHEKRLEILEARLKYLEMKRQFEENPPKIVSFDDIEQSVKARK
jgi:hypothetical protein